MKPVEFLGNSLNTLCEFPKDARQATGYQLRRVQEGNLPEDFKTRPDIGQGVVEIRIWVSSGTYRAIYTARLIDKVYVLHAFQKKTQKTLDRDNEIAKKRFKQLMRGRQ